MPLYSVVVRCRGRVHIVRLVVIDSVIPALINHLQRQISFLFTGWLKLFFFFSQKWSSQRGIVLTL